jgi:putative lipoprotein (rSAM/lipoprotein system)
MAAVARRKCSANLEVCRPQEVQCKPSLRQAARTTYGKILAALLSLLGFSAVVSSCTKYGCCPCDEIRPQVTGSVVSDKNNVPIEGIRAVLKDDYAGYDTTYTAKNGSFFLKLQYPTCDDGVRNFRIELHDVDDETNGSFVDMEIPIAAKSEQDIGTIRMTPKE